MPPEVQARQQRLKISTQVRRSRSIARSGILLLACLYGMIAIAVGAVGLIPRGGAGLQFVALMLALPILFVLVHIGLLFWAKTKTVSAGLIAILLGIPALAACFLTGRTTWFGLILIACGYCIYGVTTFRKHRTRYHALAKRHQEKGWMGRKPERGEQPAISGEDRD